MKFENVLAVFLVIYLLFIGIGAATIIVYNFPTVDRNAVIFPNSFVPPMDDSEEFYTTNTTSLNALYPNEHRVIIYPFDKPLSKEQGLLILALFAGITGSFIHAAQSLSSYIGNKEFKSSWTAWYLLRPWIGGIL